MRLPALAIMLGSLLAACGDGGSDGDASTQPAPPAGATQAAATPAAADVELAPELVGLVDWVNSPPLTLAELRGEPVLLVFWASW